MSFKAWVSNSPTVKLAVICVLTLLLLIPSAFVFSLISERSARQSEAKQEVSSKWGSEQTVTGPVISVPYIKRGPNPTDPITTHYIHIMPDKVGITGKINPEIRHRGIYDVVVYNTELNFTGTLAKPKINITGINEADILWKDAIIYIGLNDLKGVKNTVKFNVNSKDHEAMPGIDTKDVCSEGLSGKIDLSADSLLDIKFNLTLNGTEQLKFVPVGKETSVKLNSPWQSPSFDGAYLPDTKADIGPNGFNAAWNVLYLNRSFPQVWTGNEYNVQDASFGVKLDDGINHYDKTTRSAKYAIMFLGLTFLSFFLTEVLSKKRIHSIQYLLIGFALCLFYVLLLSLSEQIGFNMAYLVASIAIILQITFYAHSFLKTTKNSLVVFAVLAALYGFLFTTLQLEDYSLLIGSIALFIILSLTMYLSRKVEWGALQFNSAEPKPGDTIPPAAEVKVDG